MPANPEPPAATGPPVATPPSTPAAPGHLVALTANLQNPYARPGRVDQEALLGRLETFARLVESDGAGVVLCQEVGRDRDFRVDQWLAARLGMTAVYQRANGDAERFGREEGLAILSRYPLSAPVSCLLGGGLWRRPAMGAVVESPLGEVAVYTAHLSLRPWRNRRQPARLRAWVEATAGERPAIIGGDFNAHETAPQVAALREAWVDAFRAIHPTGDGATHALRLFGRVVSRRRLDYLFLTQLYPKIRVVNCDLPRPDDLFSDHRAVVGLFDRM
jgi:endonuclease/exonuclease/phosphatase family metal-dependent hydrolase